MHVQYQVAALVLALAGPVFGHMDFKLSDCSESPASELLFLPERSVSPYPVGVPGQISVTGQLNLNRNATGPFALDLSVQHWAAFIWVTIPCVGGVGSCRLEDVCGILDKQFNDSCPPQFVDNDLPCRCPFMAGSYRMDDVAFDIPELTGLWSWVATGDYKVTARLLDASDQEVACQHLEGTLVDGHPPCSGFLCSVFG